MQAAIQTSRGLLEKSRISWHTSLPRILEMCGVEMNDTTDRREYSIPIVTNSISKSSFCVGVKKNL